jgi:hypothetical protein
MSVPMPEENQDKIDYDGYENVPYRPQGWDEGELGMFQPVELPSKYAKAIVAIIGAALAVLVVAITDNHVNGEELAHIALAVVTAFGVYMIPNLPSGILAWSKMIVAVVGTGLQALIPFLGGEMNTANWIVVLMAALSALSVGIVPNVKTEPVLVEGEGLAAA